MTPYQKLLRNSIEKSGFTGAITEENVEGIYEELDESGRLQDIEQDVREGEVETNIRAPFSRHYEARSVAAKMSDGTWIGWTYWYGGGKHAEPEAIDWKGEAYELILVSEKPVTTIERTFEIKKTEQQTH